MRRQSSILLWVVMMATTAMAGASPADNLEGMQFAEGQLWSIKSASPTTTKVIVGRKEQWQGRVAIHVSLVDVPLPVHLGSAGGTTTIVHMPFDEAALAASVNKLLGTDASPAPGFEDGYRHWQSAQGGIFTIGVSEAVETIFVTLEHGQTPQ